MTDNPKLKVFISSPKKGLEEERNKLLESLPDFQVKVSGMENFPPLPTNPSDACLENVKDSDAVILLVGPYYGSVNSDSGLSNTEDEYRCAEENGIPLFCFLKAKSPDKWQPQDEKDDLKKRHQIFFDQVKKEKWITCFSSPEDLVLKARELSGHFIKERKQKSGPLIEAKFFYAPFLGEGKLFSHNQVIVGRKEEIENLGHFINSDQKIAILVGRGGIGKSKILYEVSERNVLKRILFLNENHNLKDVISSLPSGNSTLIVDDAHRYEDLRAFLSVFRGSDFSERLKVILSLRPSGLPRLDGILADLGIDPRQVYRPPQLKNIKAMDSKQIASEILIDKHPATIERLVKLTSDCTLALVIACRLLNLKQRLPLNLIDSEEFVRIVLNRFLVEVKKQLGDKQNDRLFSFLSALSPVRTADQEFSKKTCKLLRIESWELARMIDEMEKAGLLVRKGRYVKLAPDLVSDHILYENTIRGGRKTGFVERMFAHFGDHYASNLLINFSELEWKEKISNRGIDLLSDVWKDVKKRFSKADNHIRIQILKSVKKVAFYQPEHVYDLVKRALKKDGNELYKIGKFEFKWEHQRVIDELPDLLEPIAYNPAYTERACNVLWKLSKKDPRDPNPNLDHPYRKLKELAAYRIYKAISFNERIFDIVARWSKEKDAFKHKHTPLPILDEFLDKEVEHTTSDAGTFSFASYGLNYEAAKQLRYKVIESIAALIKPNQLRISSLAFTSLKKALAYPHGSMGRTISEKEEKNYLGEQIKILDILKSKVLEMRSRAFHFRIKDELAWYKKHGRHEALKKKVDEVFAAISEDYEFKICWAIAGHHQDDFEANYSEKQKQRQDEIKAITKDFIDLEKYPIKKIELVMEDFEETGDNYNANFFLSEVVTQKPSLGFEILSNIMKRPKSVISKYASSIVWPLFREKENQDRVREFIRKSLKTRNLDLHRNIAQAYAYGGLVDAYDDSKDFELLRRLSSIKDDFITDSVCHALSKLGSSSPDPAKKIAFSIPFSNDRNSADKILGIFGNYGIKYDKISKRDVQEIFRILLPVPNVFDGQDWHVEQFLGFTAKAFPDETVQFVIDRYKTCLQIRRKKSYKVSLREDRYSPLPMLGFDTALSGLSSSPKYEIYVREVIRLALQPKWKEIDLFWLPKLFQTISDNFSSKAIKVVTDSIKQRSVILERLALLLRDAESDFIFKHVPLVARLLLESAAISETCHKRVKSSLFGIAISGGTSRSIGVPSEKSQKLTAKGLDIAQTLPEGSVERQFYEEVSREGKRLEHEELERDEELDIVDG